MRAVSYHPLTHADDESQIQCELCDLALLNEVTPAIATENPGIDLPFISTVYTASPLDYASLFRSDLLGEVYFCRPPPFVI